MTKTKEGPQVLSVYEAGDVTHYSLSSGVEGGSRVTVRVGAGGVFACLTCYAENKPTSCVHVRIAKEFANASR